MHITDKDNTFDGYLSLIGNGREGLEGWLDATAKEVDAVFSGRTQRSCILINANPFTVGHRYLIEIASGRSQAVVVFVIQGRTESGSRGNHEKTGIEIPFEDRLGLVKQCTQDLGNVLVLPSGQYLISRDDYPASYLKEKLGNVPAHAMLNSLTLCLTARAIGAGTIFAGDEPRDEMSEIHLNALRQRCRENSITIKVAERKRLGDRYISSAMVREALSRGRCDELPLLVPNQVQQYLASHAAQYLAVGDSLDVDKV